MNPRVDEFLDDADRWREEMAMLRALCLDAGLDEEIKWSKPCYSLDGANVALIQPFKEFCALMFFKGALLDDPDDLLEKPGDNTQAARRIRFESLEDVAGREGVLARVLAHAIEVEESGREVDFEERPEPVPEELQTKLDRDPELLAAFEGLTPGRQRQYILHVSGAKQAKTRASRVEKAIPGILAGKGLTDR
jgi:uncharacterized protein YdeI (YjbR/CyaY-like superfamily)